MKDETARETAESALELASSARGMAGLTDMGMGALDERLTKLEQTVNNFRRGDIKDCPKCGHPTPMLKMKADSVSITASGYVLIPKYQCLVCGQVYTEKTDAKTELVAQNEG